MSISISHHGARNNLLTDEGGDLGDCTEGQHKGWPTAKSLAEYRKLRADNKSTEGFQFIYVPWGVTSLVAQDSTSIDGKTQMDGLGALSMKHEPNPIPVSTDEKRKEMDRKEEIWDSKMSSIREFERDFPRSITDLAKSFHQYIDAGLTAARSDLAAQVEEASHDPNWSVISKAVGDDIYLRTSREGYSKAFEKARYALEVSQDLPAPTCEDGMIALLSSIPSSS